MKFPKEETVHDLFKKICCIGLSIIIILFFFDFNSTKKYTVMDFENGFYAMDFGDSLNTFTTSNNDSRMSIDLSKTYVDEVVCK